MKLAALQVKNFKGIGTHGCTIRIDKIVVLIGPNNAGKSTVLDAYEVFASGGRELDLSHFNEANPGEPSEITGIFDSITPDDEAIIGSKWKHTDHEYGECIKVRYLWTRPNGKGQKQSFNSTTLAFEDGGVGGWDSLLQSRIPQPVRLRPSDPVDTTQTRIVGMLKEFVKIGLKADASSTKAAFEEIERLALKLFSDSKSAFDEVAQKITSNLAVVFPGTTLEVVPRSKDTLDEKLIAADSYLRVGTTHGASTPLAQQGTGLQRALLWSALSVMSEPTGKKKTKSSTDGTRILLIDEPEAFLHPPTIRSARDSLYDFALNNNDWQVIATTHSPIFIDLSKDHTTVVRVDPRSPDQRYVSTDKVSFDADERIRMQMIRECNPIVNEFFFYDKIVLVEGPTENLVVRHVSELTKTSVHVIDCMGKANIPLFARILNHFRVPYLAIHDSDTPFVARKKKMTRSGTWTLNASIRNAATAASLGRVFTQVPHFEGEFLDEELDGGKVDRVLQLLSDTKSDEYLALVDTYSRALSGDPSVLTTDVGVFDKKVSEYKVAKGLSADPRWV